MIIGVIGLLDGDKLIDQLLWAELNHYLGDANMKCFSTLCEDEIRNSPTTRSPVWTPIFLMAAANNATLRLSSPYVTFTISSLASAGSQKTDKNWHNKDKHKKNPFRTAKDTWAGLTSGICTPLVNVLHNAQNKKGRGGQGGDAGQTETVVFK